MSGSTSAPKAVDDLHPKVRAWIAQHKREQKERELKHRRRERDRMWWGESLLGELTERDLYRFRMTSAVFYGVEKAGGKLGDTPVNGKVIFLVNGYGVSCSIVEKMLKNFMRSDQKEERWTAYPEFHQTGLRSSGFLRVTITTYLRGGSPQWVETDKMTIADWLPEIVGTIIGAGLILDQEKRDREESERRRQEENARREERQRLRAVEEQRWNRFQERAADWERRARLLAFLAEVNRRLEVDGDEQVGDRRLSEWINWAREKIDASDPFRAGMRGLFGS